MAADNYAQGNTILDDDYNIFATGNAAGTGDNNEPNINTVWGTGTGDKGYGQTNTLSAVSAGSVITATQWATLLTRMTSIAAHQGTSITAISNPSAGDTIAYYAALQTNINSIFNNRNNAAANGTDITTNGTTTTSSTWDVQAATTKTVTFADAASLRYFFNAGGHIRMSFSLTGGSDAKSQEWADLLTKTGTIAPTTLATGTGAEDYTGTATTIFLQYADSAPYTANYIRIQASVSGSTITFSVLLRDDAADTIAPDGSGSGNALDVVDGTLTMTTVVRPPSTSNLNNNSWGTPSMNAASWSLSS